VKLPKESCQVRDTVSLLIGSDLCPAGGYEAAFRGKNAGDLFGDLLELFQEADCSLVNLECPLTELQPQAVKTGACLRADPSCIRILSGAGITACNLANNHSMDYGPSGLNDTLRTCHDAGIKTFGAGETLDAAGKPLIHEAKGVRIGVIACAEHEWSIARSDYPGANPLSMPETLWQIRDLREQVDFLLVLVHGGREHYPLPYPQLQTWCRYMVGEGADAVICQHSHCIGGWEQFGDGLIGYGQGNLFFQNYATTGEAWHEGVLVRFDITGRGFWKYELIPYRQSQEFPGIRRMDAESEQELSARMNGWAATLTDSKALAFAWENHCLSHESTYLGILAGGGRYIRGLFRKFPVLRRWYSSEKRRVLLNALRCQAHYAITRTILEQSESKAEK